MEKIKRTFFRLLVCGMVLTMAVCCFNTVSVTADEGEECPNVIYLTFDDGPSFVTTDKILDVLKEKGIKGTFFVVGCKIQEREHILKRIYEEGHSIGLHSYTHIAKKVYGSHEGFMEEMNKTGEAVYSVVGIYPKILRFPGGSKPFLNAALLDKLHRSGYRIFDWNACIPDGINNQASVEVLYKESKKIIGNSKRVFMLLHCDQPNENTVKVLPQIIEYYQSKGYEFKPITEETSEFYFRFNR